MKKDNTKRFSEHVDDYIKYRPSYPQEMIDVLEKCIGLNSKKTIADIGSGTGISSIPFLENGNVVYGIEPNKEMRNAQALMLEKFPTFKSVNGSAEKTTLSDKSVDIIFSGQAFHWFDKEASKKEFKRILSPGGHIVLVWNSRNTQSELQKAYEQILYENIKEYQDVNHHNVDKEVIAQFFSPRELFLTTLQNAQEFDLAGLKGRLRSSSYCPKDGPVFNKLMGEMDTLFSKYQNNGKIAFTYETLMYWN
ncbi:class I SAM-dependent methyltransferase [Niabella aquatica]